MSTRQPDAQVYNLGHYEQMQIELAIAFAIEHAPHLDKALPGDAAVLRRLRPLFGSGTTQITHQPDSQ